MELARNIVDLIMGFVIVMTIVTVAFDIIKWSVTGDSENFGSFSTSYLNGVIKEITLIPVRMIAAIIALIFKVVESVVRTVIGLVAPPVADQIKFIDLNISDLMS